LSRKRRIGISGPPSFRAGKLCDVGAFEGVKWASKRGKKRVKTASVPSETRVNACLVGIFLHENFLNSYKRIRLTGIDNSGGGWYIPAT
jgi:hypothetical protein